MLVIEGLELVNRIWWQRLAVGISPINSCEFIFHTIHDLSVFFHNKQRKYILYIVTPTTVCVHTHMGDDVLRNVRI